MLLQRSMTRRLLRQQLRNVASYHRCQSSGSYSKNEQTDNNSSNYKNFFGLFSSGLVLAGAAAVAIEEGEEPESSGDAGPERKKLGVNSSDIKQIQYQNRIRRYSTPDKVFRLFATVKVVEKIDEETNIETIYMTADDFVRSITPGDLQPEGLGLDEYHKVKGENLTKYLKKMEHSYSKGELFTNISDNGLLTFNDYIFLLTVLGTSAKHWQILFKVFDENGDGEVDKDEFQKVMKLARVNTSAGERHRDTGDNKVKNVLRKLSAISQYFYPTDDDKLTLDRFLVFHEQLKTEILRIQFDKEQPNEDDKISKLSFAKMLIEYMESGDTYQELDRVKKVLTNANKRSEGIAFEQVHSLYKVLSCADDIEMSLDMHTSAKIELSQDTFKHIAWVVAKERIDNDTLEVMWSVFDEDGSGGLSNREFLRQVKNRASFGLDKPSDTGLWRLFHAMWQCSKEQVGNTLGLNNK